MGINEAVSARVAKPTFFSIQAYNIGIYLKYKFQCKTALSIVSPIEILRVLFFFLPTQVI